MILVRMTTGEGGGGREGEGEREREGGGGTFILQKILLVETGLSYICQTYERFSHVAMILVCMTTGEGGRGRERGREGEGGREREGDIEGE